MTGLVLKLKPKERVLVNGAVIENGDKRSKFSIVTPNANILRLADALHPDEVNTPVRRVCYIAQLILSGDAKPDEGMLQLNRGIEQLSQIFTDEDSRKILDKTTAELQKQNYYLVLKNLRSLITREDRLLAAARYQ